MARSLDDAPPQSPDPLTLHSEEAGVWGDPSDAGTVGQTDAQLPQTFDYSAGIFSSPVDEAAAMPMVGAQLIPLRSDAPSAFRPPHEPTHREYEPPRVIPINQSAAGYTQILPGHGLQYVKMIACVITLSDAGSIAFCVGGDSAGAPHVNITGALQLGGSSAPGFVLPPSGLENPWLFTSPDQAFGLFTVTGTAQGWCVCAYSPYDQ